MTIKFGPKQLLMITYFLTDNKWTTAKELKEFFKDEISNKTITTTLKLNNLNKDALFFLFIVTLDERGKIYQLKTDLDTFLLLAMNFLKSNYTKIFFESKYIQQFIKNRKIMKFIQKNLNVTYDEDTLVKIHQIIQNSPSALYFTLFANGLLSQKVKKEDILPEEAEHEIRENIISRLLDDLRDKDFFLSENLESLGITVITDWKFKDKKETKFQLELDYKH